MKATLEFLGTGSAFNFKDGNLSAIIEFGDNLILIDCGFDVPQKLKDKGLLDKVTHILITHTHSDHIGGLELLAQWRYWVSQHSGVKPPKLIVTPDVLELIRSVGKAGLEHVQDQFGRPLKASLETYFDVSTSESKRSFIIGDTRNGIVIKYIPVDHVPGGFPSYGISIQIGNNYIGNKQYWYSGDTRKTTWYCDPGVDLIFHDCQLVKYGEGDVHVSFSDLVRDMPKELKRKTWLMHYNGTPYADLNGFAGFVVPGQRFELN
jgi:ribonuclease BN (tRNA processing enzyme)